MMNLEITRPIDREAWLTALHAKGSSDSRLAGQMDEAEKLLKAASRPKAVYKIIEISDILSEADKSNVAVESFSIRKHLAGCHKAV